MVVYLNGCSGLTSINIPDGVTSIGDNAFYSCTSLSSITIPDKVTSIDNGAFFGCSGLTGITVEATIPPTLGSIVLAVTNDCPIYVPAASVAAYQTAWSTYASRIQAIPAYKLSATYSDSTTYTVDCNGDGTLTYSEVNGHSTARSAMTSAIVGDCVTSLGQNTFAQCTILSSVSLPNGLTSIDYGVFLFDRGLTNITIPDSVTSIGNYALHECTSLSSCTIGSGVTSIGQHAFDNCKSLTGITIPSGVTTVSEALFAGCSGLQSINIPETVTTIEGWAYWGCSGATNLTIGSGITSIGEEAFIYCSGLTGITIEATIPPTLGNAVFDNTNDCPIYVPAASVAAYQTAWSTYASRIQPIV